MSAPEDLQSQTLGSIHCYYCPNCSGTVNLLNGGVCDYCDTKVDYSKSAIGLMTISPAETAVIAADIAMKAAGIDIGFVDRFSGTLIVTGTISETEAALKAVLEYVNEKMGFKVCKITRT